MKEHFWQFVVEATERQGQRVTSACRTSPLVGTASVGSGFCSPESSVMRSFVSAVVCALVLGACVETFAIVVDPSTKHVDLVPPNHAPALGWVAKEMATNDDIVDVTVALRQGCSAGELEAELLAVSDPTSPKYGSRCCAARSPHVCVTSVPLVVGTGRSGRSKKWRVLLPPLTAISTLLPRGFAVPVQCRSQLLALATS